MEVKPQVVKHGSFMLTEVECEKLLAVLSQWEGDHKDSVYVNFIRSLETTLHDLRREFS